MTGFAKKRGGIDIGGAAANVDAFFPYRLASHSERKRGTPIIFLILSPVIPSAARNLHLHRTIILAKE